MNDLIVAFFIWFGGFFLLVAAIGLVRLPDVFMRMHAATKAGTLGIASLTIGVGFYFGDMGTALRAMLIVAFFLITAPIAGHMIGRAAYHRGNFRPEKLVCDEYAGSLAAKPDRGEKPVSGQEDEAAQQPSL